MRPPEFSLEDILKDIQKSNKEKSERKPDTKNLKSPDIYNNKILELEPYIKDLLLELKENLEQGKYQLIIGEDASGRIPALIMKKCVDHIYHKAGKSVIPLRFVAGFGRSQPSSTGEYDKMAILKENLSEFKDSTALVVTEHVSSGNSLHSMYNLLKEIGMEADFGSLGIQADKEYYPELDEKLYTGKEKQPSPVIFGHYQMGGVSKQFDKPYAEKYPKSEEEVVKARSDVENVSKKIITWYDSLPNNPK